MFYNTAENHHGLLHDPFKAIVSPRPIGWIGSVSSSGAFNLAPYSFFNAICDTPKLVMFSSSGFKDSVRNIQDTKEFTCNLAGKHLQKQMNLTSAPAPHGASEFELAGLTPVRGELVAAPYVGEAFAALECRLTQFFQPDTLSGTPADNFVVIGEVVGIHISGEAVKNGRLDMATVRPLGRMGYMDYCDAGDVFEMLRP